MYKVNKIVTGTLEVNNSTTGETIETKIRRILEAKEPITDRAELIYTDRKDGVLPAYDIRTDRHEMAVTMQDVAARSEIAKRQEKHKPKEQETPQEGGKTEENKPKG